MKGLRAQIFLFSFLMISTFFIPVFAEGEINNSKNVLIQTDKPEYKIGEIVTISGLVEEKKMPVIALKIFDPHGGIITANELEIKADNKFSKTIVLNSPFYEDEGDYRISVNYGKLQAETNFKLTSGVQNERPIEDDFQIFFPEIIAMFTDKEVYRDGDTVTIYGLVSEKDEDSVLVGVYDPFNNPTGFYFGNIDSNYEFKVSFLVKSGINFKNEGTYSISAFYGISEEIVKFNFVKLNTNQIPIKEKKTEAPIKPSIPNEKIIENTNTKSLVSNKSPKNSPQPSSKNLSVEDIELGIMLNEMKLNCDGSELIDTISYNDGMGPALTRLCRYSDAIFYYDQSLRKEPNNVEILTNKGSALTKLGLYDEAIKNYDLALVVNPTNSFTLNNKANALVNIGNYQEAIPLYKKAIDIDGSNPIILQNLEKTLDKSTKIQIQNEPIIQKIDTQPQDSPIEPEKSLIKTSTQNTENIFEQLGNLFSSFGISFFSFLS